MLAASRARKRVRQPYPVELRRSVVAYARQQRLKGVRWRTLGQQRGMSPTTVRRYLVGANDGGEEQAQTVTSNKHVLAEARAGCGPLAPVPVTIALPTAVRAPRPLVLVSPAGFRLEGLDLERAAQLLGYLG